jgi:EAL domain-containing protein (putative c-di-GMP-specific phosphodiesterase class I)
MAGALGMKVFAEGVECQSQRHFLRDSGCRQVRHFLHAPALDQLSFEQRLRQSQAAAKAGVERRVRGQRLPS